jgi:hypothetical protein
VTEHVVTERTFATWLLVAGALAAAAAAVLFRHVDPNAADSPLPGCIFYALTELYCAGCGITRALHALAHGDVLRALHMNPLAVFMLVATPLMLLHVRGWRPDALQPVMRVLLSGAFWLVLLPTYMLLRNLPWWPFTLLAPG